MKEQILLEEFIAMKNKMIKQRSEAPKKFRRLYNNPIYKLVEEISQLESEIIFNKRINHGK